MPGVETSLSSYPYALYGSSSSPLVALEFVTVLGARIVLKVAVGFFSELLCREVIGLMVSAALEVLVALGALGALIALRGAVDTLADRLPLEAIGLEVISRR